MSAGRRAREPRGEGGAAPEPAAAALVGQPLPDAEMASEEAAGVLLERDAPRVLAEREEARDEKKRKTPGMAKCPPPEDIEDVHQCAKTEALQGRLEDDDGAVVMGPLPSAGSRMLSPSVCLSHRPLRPEGKECSLAS